MASPNPVAEAQNIWAVAQAQFDTAADQLDLDPGLRRVLRVPQRELTVNFPVSMDDGHVEVFTGYRVQHNIAAARPRAASATTRTSTSTRSARWRCG